MNKKSMVLYTLAIVVAVGVLNVRSFSGYFAQDDFTLLHGVYDKGPLYFVKLFFTDCMRELWPGWRSVYEQNGMGFVRPVLLIYVKLNYLLFGTNPLGYHLVNLSIHVVNALLVFLIIQFVTGNRRFGFMAAMLFAVHPLQPKVVVFISSCCGLLATSFYLASFYFFIRYHANGSKAHYLSSVACFFLGLFTKESLIVLPMHLVAYVLMQDYLQSAGPLKVFPWIKDRLLKKALAWAPYGAVVVFYFAMRKVATGNFLGGQGGGFNVEHKLFSFLEYIRIALFASAFDPIRHQLAYGVGPVWAKSTPGEVAIALFLFFALLVPVFFKGLKNIAHGRLFLFGVLWTGVSYVPILALHSYMSPHILSPLIVGVIAMLIAVAFSLYREKIALVLLALLIAGYGLYQYKYSSEWTEGELIAKNIKETVETAAANFKKGDAIILIDVPMFHKTAMVFYGNIEYALQRPSCATDLYNDFDVKLFTSAEVKSLAEASPNAAAGPLGLDGIKMILKDAPMLRPWQVDNLVKPPDFFKDHADRQVYLFKWSARTTKLEEVSEGGMALLN